MPTSCCAFNCISRQSKRSGISFFRIPKDVERRKQWLHAIKRGSVDKSDEPWDPKGHERICGKHFMSGKASDNPKHPDYVPSIFDFPTTPHQQEKSLKSKCNRAAKRQKRDHGSIIHVTNTHQSTAFPAQSSRPEQREAAVLLYPQTPKKIALQSGTTTNKTHEGKMSLDYNNPDFAPSVLKNDKNNKACKKRKTDKTRKKSCNIAFSAGENVEIEWPELDDLRVRHIQLQVGYTDLQAKVDSLLAENDRLKEDLYRALPRFSYSSLKGDDAQLMFLSGLHSLVFDWLVTQITARTQRLNLELNTQDHLLIVLMKLKLGLCDRDLGYRFRIRESSVTTICQTWIPAVAFMLKPLIAWPNVETVAKQRPAMFERKFSKCRGIIDFPEFIVTKTTDKAPENTTVRYFSSVTPAGTVSFLSSGYSEDMSKSQIAKECGFLHLLERQDEILSRKKINVKDDLASLGATLHTPEYVDGKLVPKSDLEKMVWTHAKNVIGWWKDFKLLEKVVPETYGNLLDDVLTVCAALTNVNLSVFPKASDKKS